MGDNFLGIKMEDNFRDKFDACPQNFVDQIKREGLYQYGVYALHRAVKLQKLKSPK